MDNYETGLEFKVTVVIPVTIHRHVDQYVNQGVHKLHKIQKF